MRLTHVRRGGVLLVAAVRDVQLVVTDGHDVTERAQDVDVRTEPVSGQGLSFRQFARGTGWSARTTYVTDPRRASDGWTDLAEDHTMDWTYDAATEAGNVVQTGRRQPGTGTGSATPLAWTHAQFVRLAWSIQQGAPVERPTVVACRYTDTC